MSEPIDLSAERSKRDQPDAELIRRDDFGREMRRYAFDYEFDGQIWGFDLWAYSMKEAERRGNAISRSVRLLGEIHATVPA